MSDDNSVGASLLFPWERALITTALEDLAIAYSRIAEKHGGEHDPLGMEMAARRAHKLAGEIAKARGVVVVSS